MVVNRLLQIVSLLLIAIKKHREIKIKTINQNFKANCLLGVYGLNKAGVNITNQLHFISK